VQKQQHHRQQQQQQQPRPPAHLRAGLLGLLALGRQQRLLDRAAHPRRRQHDVAGGELRQLPRLCLLGRRRRRRLRSRLRLLRRHRGGGALTDRQVVAGGLAERLARLALRLGLGRGPLEPSVHGSV